MTIYMYLHVLPAKYWIDEKSFQWFVGEEPCSSNKESSKSRIKACVSDADLWMLLDAVIPCINLPTAVII